MQPSETDLGGLRLAAQLVVSATMGEDAPHKAMQLYPGSPAAAMTGMKGDGEGGDEGGNGGGA